MVKFTAALFKIRIHVKVGIKLTVLLIDIDC